MTSTRIGLVLPIEGDIVRFARRAEELGYDSFAAPEHVAFHGATPNSFMWLAAAAGATSSIDLVSTVSLAPLYPAVLFAKLVASLDYVSGGRFSVGVGVGGEYPEEFRACSVPTSERGARTDEALEVMRQLLSADGPTSFNGKWTSFDDLHLSPRISDHRPPIWIGGRRDAAVRRVARFGDVWMPYMVSPHEVAAGEATMRSQAESIGRDPAELTVAAYLFAVVADDDAGARSHALNFTSDRYNQDFSKLSSKFLLGPAGTIATRMADYAAAGASTFILEFACNPDLCDAQMSRFATEVLPLVKEM